MGALVSNNAWGVLSIPMTPDSTKLLLSASQGERFPRALAGVSWFYVTVVNDRNDVEIMKCTNRSADSFDVERGVDGTIPLRFDAGSRVELRPVAALINDKADNDALKKAEETIRKEFKDADSTDFKELERKILEGDNAIKKDYATTEYVDKKFKETTDSDKKTYETIEGAKKKYLPLEGGELTGSLTVASETGRGSFFVKGGDITVTSHRDSVAGVTYGGNLSVSGTAKAEVFRSTSDVRKKDNIKKLDAHDAMAKLLCIGPSSFRWKSTGEQDLGFIAQELKEVFPELVKEDSDGFLTVNYQGLVPVMVSAIQLLFFRVTDLEQKLRENK